MNDPTREHTQSGQPLTHAADGSAAVPDGAAPALTRLGDYRIIREVGRGGMGVVYEAEQVSLGRHVALKVLLGPMMLDRRHRQRFEREARAAAKLHHTNIVPVFGVGESDGLHFYAMQFIDGLGLDVVRDELTPMRDTSGWKPEQTSVDEIRVITPGASATGIARSLLTGGFDLGELHGTVDHGDADRPDRHGSALTQDVGMSPPIAPAARRTTPRSRRRWTTHTGPLHRRAAATPPAVWPERGLRPP